MIIIIIKVIQCFSFAWCLLIQNSSEEGCSVIYWTSTNFNIFIINCLLSVCKERSKEVLKKYSADFGGADQQLHSIWKKKSSGQFRILEELGKCGLGGCFILCFKISCFPPGTQLEYFWNQSITVVRIQWFSYFQPSLQKT